MSEALDKLNTIVADACEKSLLWMNEAGANDPEIKNDGSPVTIVDKKLNEFVVEQIKLAFPDDAVVGEESENHAVPTHMKRIWYVDPLDGTKEFVRGSEQWSIIVGLAEKNKPVMGAVGHPLKGKIYSAESGKGAFQRDLISKATTPILVNDFYDPEKLTMVGSQTSLDPKEPSLMSALNIASKFKQGSIGLKAAVIASGQGDLYVNSHGWCSYWDLVASDVILQEAGGQLLDFDLNPLDYDSAKGIRVDRGFIMSTTAVIDKYRMTILEALK